MSDHESRYDSQSMPPTSNNDDEKPEGVGDLDSTTAPPQPMMTSPSCVIDQAGQGVQHHQPNRRHRVVEMEQQQLRLKENPGLISPSLDVSSSSHHTRDDDSDNIDDTVGQLGASPIHERSAAATVAAEAAALPPPSSSSSGSNRRLRFSMEVMEQEPSIVWEMEDMLAMWWTPADIQSFHRDAKAKAQSFLRRSETFRDTFQAVFQDCSREMSSQELLETESVRSLLASATTLRGLESRTIGIIREYRKYHVRSVLDVTAQGTVDALVRSRSLRTSKASSTLARILATQDYIAIAHMIRKELDGIPPSSSSSSEDAEGDHDAAASTFSVSSSPREQQQQHQG